VVSLNTTVALPQLSVAVTVGTVGSAAEQDMVISAGKMPLNVGFTVSVTVITCVCEIVFPQTSVAVHTLVSV